MDVESIHIDLTNSENVEMSATENCNGVVNGSAVESDIFNESFSRKNDRNTDKMAFERLLSDLVKDRPVIWKEPINRSKETIADRATAFEEITNEIQKHFGYIVDNNNVDNQFIRRKYRASGDNWLKSYKKIKFRNETLTPYEEQRYLLWTFLEENLSIKPPRTVLPFVRKKRKGPKNEFRKSFATIRKKKPFKKLKYPIPSSVVKLDATVEDFVLPSTSTAKSLSKRLNQNFLYSSASSDAVHIMNTPQHHASESQSSPDNFVAQYLDTYPSEEMPSNENEVTTNPFEEHNESCESEDPTQMEFVPSKTEYVCLSVYHSNSTLEEEEHFQTPNNQTQIISSRTNRSSGSEGHSILPHIEDSDRNSISESAVTTRGIIQEQRVKETIGNSNSTFTVPDRVLTRSRSSSVASRDGRVQETTINRSQSMTFSSRDSNTGSTSRESVEEGVQDRSNSRTPTIITVCNTNLNRSPMNRIMGQGENIPETSNNRTPGFVLSNKERSRGPTDTRRELAREENMQTSDHLIYVGGGIPNIGENSDRHVENELRSQLHFMIDRCTDRFDVNQLCELNRGFRELVTRIAGKD